MRKYVLHKLSNKKLMEKALEQIEEETGFHIEDVEYGSCYFIADGPKNSICHFHIKEIPGFIFAFWNTNRFDKIENQIKDGITLWSDYYSISSKSELVFFTQYERDVDKFKPSYSSFVTGIYRLVWEEGDSDKPIRKEEFDMCDLVEILNFMKKHPIKSYVYVSSNIHNVVNELSGIRCLYIYIKDWINNKRYEYKESHKLKSLTKKCCRMLNKLSEFDYILADYGECHSPRLHLIMRRCKNMDYDLYMKQLDIIERFSTKYFNDTSIDIYDVDDIENLYNDKKLLDEDMTLKVKFHKRYVYMLKEENDIKVIKTKNGGI